MKQKTYYSPKDVDPTKYDEQFKFMMRESMGAESTQDQEFQSSDIGPILKSDDGNKFRLKVDNNGNLSTEEV